MGTVCGDLLRPGHSARKALTGDQHVVDNKLTIQLVKLSWPVPAL